MLGIYDYVSGYSKRTLLGGYLPVANIGVWNPDHQAGYEVIVLLPPGTDSKPIARVRYLIPNDQLRVLELQKTDLDGDSDEAWGASPSQTPATMLYRENGQSYMEVYWNTSAEKFHETLFAIWGRWHQFHDERAMKVDIPDDWLRNAALAGLTLSRCSYRGLEPTYQVGEGSYTAFAVPPNCDGASQCAGVPFSDALFPVSAYEFVWAHQLWNHLTDADAYLEFYLSHYVLPSGDFLYNTQDQVEAPLNIGVFLAVSARSYFYGRNSRAFEGRMKTLERMIGFALRRYEYSKLQFPAGDRRRGLIWGSPEADLGDPARDRPDDHPFYYQNAVWIWRGLTEHSKALAQWEKDSGSEEYAAPAKHYESVAREMRSLIEDSISATRKMQNAAMRNAGITSFTPHDVDREVTHLTNYENHRFIEDWLLADWGDQSLDAGHLKHRELSGRHIFGLALSHAPSMVSNFMAHGTLNALIRQDDYRPFLMALYGLTCYAADSGNRYAPEDAVIPGGHPLEGAPGQWSAVINSTLQATLGLRWLLCYEETDAPVCHLQKAAPTHWFDTGQRIEVRNCPTRFGVIGWSTRTLGERSWTIDIDLPPRFAGELVIHIHPNDRRPLRKASVGTLRGNQIVISRGSIANHSKLRITAS